jgi:hypothetical protein
VRSGYGKQSMDEEGEGEEEREVIYITAEINL